MTPDEARALAEKCAIAARMYGNKEMVPMFCYRCDALGDKNRHGTHVKVELIGTDGVGHGTILIPMYVAIQFGVDLMRNT